MNPPIPGHRTTFAMFNLSKIFTSGNEILVHYFQCGGSLKLILNLISSVGTNELYILHYFDNSIA
jgi:hypothetical protein